MEDTLALLEDHLLHVGYVQCTKYGFFAGEILPPLLPRFLLQIVFEDKCGANTKLHPCTTRLCTELLEYIPLVRGRPASMTLLD